MTMVKALQQDWSYTIKLSLSHGIERISQWVNVAGGSFVQRELDLSQTLFELRCVGCLIS